jgi:uncharacterized protein YheU (UPF0270 family)
MLLCGLWNASIAQDRPQLFVKVEEVLKRREPGWKIERNLSGQTMDPLTQSIKLREGSRSAGIEIMIWRRLEDAKQIFAGNVVIFDNTRGKTAVKRGLPALGDENYMWTNLHSTLWPAICFRSGSVLVSVFAPTVTIADRFARHILEQIAKTQ